MVVVSSTKAGGGSNPFDPNRKKKDAFGAFFTAVDQGKVDQGLQNFAAAGGQLAPGLIAPTAAVTQALNDTKPPGAKQPAPPPKPAQNDPPITLLPSGGNGTLSATERTARAVREMGGGSSAPTFTRLRTGNRHDVRNGRQVEIITYNDGTEEVRDLGAAAPPPVDHGDRGTGSRPQDQQALIAAAQAPPVQTTAPPIQSLAQQAQAIDLPSHDELRRNQMAQQQAFIEQADAAGNAALSGVNTNILGQAPTERTLSPLEQMLNEQALARLQSPGIDASAGPLVGTLEDIATNRLTQEGPLIDTDSELSRQAEAVALERLGNRNLLGQDTALTTAAEQAILDRLGDPTQSARAQRQRALFEDRLRMDENRDRELLNRLGVLRSGDSIEALIEQNKRRDEGELGLAAFNEDLRDQAIQQALGFTGRRDALNLNEQQLQRAALGDVSALQGRRDQLGLAEQDLRNQAFGQVAGLQGRRDQIDLANEDLARAALGDARGIVNDTNQLALQEADRTGFLRGESTLGGRQAQLQADLATRGFQQDVTDRTLQRLRGTLDVGQRERFEEDVRARREAEQLASTADQRAERAFLDSLRSTALEREIAEAGQTGVFRRGDTLTARQLSNENRRADRGLTLQEAGLTGRLGDQQTLAGRQLDDALLSSQTGRRLTNQQILDSRLGRQLAMSADDRAGRALESDLSTADVQRMLSRNADQRQAQALEDALFGTVSTQFGTRQTQSGQDRALGREATRAGFTGQFEGDDTLAERALLDQLLNTRTDRRLAGNQDRRAGQALMSDLANARLGREATTAGLTGDFRGDRTLQGQLSDEQILSLIEDRRLAGNADVRADRAQTFNQQQARQTLEDMLFGTATDQGGTRQTLRGQGFDEDLASSRLGREATVAGLTGNFRDGRTLAGRSTDSSLEAVLAGLTGDFRGGRTLAGEQIDTDRTNQRITQLLAAKEAGLPTGSLTDIILEALNLPTTQRRPPGAAEFDGRAAQARFDELIERGLDEQTARQIVTQEFS